MPGPILPESLSPTYYRDNFLTLCRNVEQRYGDVLSTQEQAWLQRFRAQDAVGQCLLVRLLSRRGPVFRESKLSYAEVGPCGPIITALLDAGLLLEPATLELTELEPLFQLPQWRAAFPEHKRLAKRALIAAVADSGVCEHEVFQRLAATEEGRLLAPADVEVVALLRLLFFGYRGGDLTDFVLSDLGIARPYPYPLDQSRRLFSDRAAVDEYLLGAAYRDQFQLLMESAETDGIVELARAMLAHAPRYESSLGRWHRALNTVARELERLAQPALALELYRRSERHPARERSARVLEASGEFEAALALCEDIVAQPWCELESQAAGRMLPRLQRKLGLAPAKKTASGYPALHLELAPSGDGVELDAAAALGSQWRRVHYVENQLFNGLFGLLFWEQIFAPVAGVFHHPFHAVPADMYSADFALRREALLAARFEELARCDLAAELTIAWRRYHGYQCRWVHWRALSLELLLDAVAVIPREHLLAIWRRTVFDPRQNRSGYPDLIALGDEPGAYCLIEVKGPGDQLQDGQKLWLDFFAAHSIPAAVAWVSWRDD